jgi:hypothetical protein
MSREVLDSGGFAEADADDPSDIAAAPPTSRLPVLTGRRRPIGLLVLAFLVGGAVGALSWDTWQERQDAAASRAAVDLSGRLRNVTSGDEAALLQAYVQLENDGPETIPIEQVAIAGAGYVPSSDVDTSPFTVASRQSVTRRISFDVACGESSDAPAQIRLQVRTADGVSRQLLLPLQDEQRHLSQLRPRVCRPDAELRVMVSAGEAGTVIEQSERALRIPVLVQSYGATTVIASLRAVSPQLDVTAEGLPIEILGGFHAWTFLNWRVVDCTGAPTLDFQDLGLVVSGQRRGGPVVESTVSLDPDLALDVSAFIAATCSQR